jgi:hypothetical protein
MTSYVDKRQALHCYLDANTHSAWLDWSEEEGISVTGFLEAVGRMIREEPEDWQRIATSANLVKKARRIDAERRRRGR